MASQHAPHDLERRELPHLQFDATAGQEPPLGFDERTSRRQIDDRRVTARTKACLRRPDVFPAMRARDRAAFGIQRACHVPSPKLKRKMRARPVLPRMRTANWWAPCPRMNNVPEVLDPIGLKLSRVDDPI